MKYQIEFYGRRVGAIGICYNMVEVVEAESPEQACSRLYDSYEHISIRRITKQAPEHEVRS